MNIHQRTKSLAARGSALHSVSHQLEVLNGGQCATPAFDTTLAEYGIGRLRPVQTEILQVNVGKRCNQACAHCHVDAGPDRREVMSRTHLEMCLDILKRYHIPVVDITGGAPELHPDFRWFVAECAATGAKVMDRCNLTILVSHPRFEDLPGFFAEHNVHIAASLPHFARSRTDSQRGEGVFDDSIRALQQLNATGYGMDGSGLLLDLVYNPTGVFLPSSQQQLEKEFKTQLHHRHGIVFNSLYTITNMPVSRFLAYLLDTGNYSTYMQMLVEAFNPAAAQGLMCRNTLSVSWDGYLYDCDFNQMLDLKVASPVTHLSQFDPEVMLQRFTVTGRHCYGCTAGAGSSCGGAVVLSDQIKVLHRQ